VEEHSRVYKSTKTHARGLCHSAIHERDRVLRARLRAGLARRPALMAEVRRLDLGAAVRHGLCRLDPQHGAHRVVAEGPRA
jgi:hypothetical protein